MIGRCVNIPKKGNIELIKPHLIACEGLDAKLFLIQYLQSRKLIDQNIDLFQVEDFGGNPDLPLFLDTLPYLPNFIETLKSLTLVRDAENNSIGANQSIQSTLKNRNFAVPKAPCSIALPSGGQHLIKVSYILFPEFDTAIKNGTLEDLCLSILHKPENHEHILNIANNAINEYQEKFINYKWPHKNKLHTYLSLTDDFVSKKLGESARDGAFDFSAVIFNPFNELLTKLLYGS